MEIKLTGKKKNAQDKPSGEKTVKRTVRRSGAYLEKRSINLAIKEKTMNSPSRVIPAFVVAAVLIALFTKFAVIDRIAEISASENRAVAAETALAELVAANADYEAVRLEYVKYFDAAATEEGEDVTLVDRLDLMMLVENKLMSSAVVESWSASGNVLTVNLSGLTLDDTAVILQELKLSPIVQSVDVYTVGTGASSTEQGADVLMTIQLSDEGGDAQ